MAGNTFGNRFCITSFGESHGAGIGVVIDGLPAGIDINHRFLAERLARRKPGQSAMSTSRSETDRPEILSGVFRGKSTGAPIAILIRNEDQRSEDYDALETVYRPSHADFTYEKKYGLRDHRGGGRSSARITAGWVAAGALAELFLKTVSDIQVYSWVSRIGSEFWDDVYLEPNMADIEASPVRCPHAPAAQAMIAAIERARDKHDSLGGIISARVKQMPVGLGEPVFEKLNARLAAGIMSINAVKGIEFGMGFEGSKQTGSQMNDPWVFQNGQIQTVQNNSGGIQGGISNGADIYFRVAFKPTATIGREQQTINTTGEAVTLSAGGRHDPCVVPRAVPIVDAMVYNVLADLWLARQEPLS
jgi:chorismate synthase